MESEKILKRRAYQSKWRKENAEKAKAYSNKWRASNKEKDLGGKSKYRKENKEKIKKSYRQSILKSKFGLTQLDYDTMIINQNNVCAICKTACSSGRNLAVDHDHNTGNIRALLCRACNVSIALLKEDVNILYSAIEYLEKHKVKNEQQDYTSPGQATQAFHSRLRAGEGRVKSKASAEDPSDS